ncbi:MAG: hypothetical protein R6V56_07890 [Lentisphaeria bacterium]
MNHIHTSFLKVDLIRYVLSAIFVMALASPGPHALAESGHAHADEEQDEQ